MQIQKVIVMKNTNLNKLFVRGKKAALVALLATTLSPKAQAYEDRTACMSPKDQTSYQSNVIVSKDTETNKPAGSVMLLILAGILGLGSVMSYGIDRIEETKQNNLIRKQR